MLAGLPGIKVYINDILVVGKAQAELAQRDGTRPDLRAVLRCLGEDKFRLQNGEDRSQRQIHPRLCTHHL